MRLPWYGSSLAEAACRVWSAAQAVETMTGTNGSSGARRCQEPGSGALSMAIVSAGNTFVSAMRLGSDLVSVMHNTK